MQGPPSYPPFAFTIFLGLSGSLWAGAAAGAELDWQAPLGCPDRERVQQRIHDAIGMPLERAADVRFQCAVKQGPSGSYRLELRVEGSASTPGAPPRVIEAPTCDQVADTAVVAIALALGAAAPEPPSDSETAGTTADATEAPAVAAPAQPKEAAEPATTATSDKTSAAVAEPSHLWFGAGFGPVLDLGSLPGLAFGIRPVVDLGYRAGSARLWGTVFGDRRTTAADGSGGEFSLWSVGLAICGSTPRERSHATLCGGAEVGKLAGSGVGALKVARNGSAWWVTPQVELEVASAPWLFGMRTYIGGTVGVPLLRRPFTFDGAETVHRAGAIVGRLNAGLEIDWP